jgi:glyoxylase-like metal-dependent hydrolase (beta-lactamase superfamily II)
MFVYTADDAPICFDTGISEDTVRQGFDDLGFAPEDVKYVFLTHTDNDHVGGLNLFKNADVYLSIDEEQMINRATPRFLGFAYNPPLKKTYSLLQNGDIVQAGKTRIEALATPGHTPGSMSYLVNDSILFVGDALALKEGKVRRSSRLHLRDIVHMDLATQTESVKRLAKLANISLMATAHTGYTTDFQSAMSAWV